MNEQELKEYIEYLISQGFTQDEAKEYLTEQGMMPKEQGIGGQILEGVGRALDYTGGLGRTAVAQVADVFTDKDLVQEGDWSKAFKGQAPSGEQILDRAGMEEGFGRDAAGFALEVLADPLTYTGVGALAKGAGKGLAKAGLQKTGNVVSKTGKAVDSALNLPSTAISKGGKGLYKFGMGRIDEISRKYGKEPVSDLLLEKGIKGSNRQIAEQMEALGKALGKEKQSILKQADNAGVSANMDTFTKEADAFIKYAQEIEDPQLLKAAAKLQKQVDQYKNIGLSGGDFGPRKQIKPSVADEYRQNIDKLIPKSAWEQMSSKHTPQYIEGLKDLRRGASKAVYDSVDQIGRKADLERVNKELGQVLTSKDTQLREAFKEGVKPGISAVDLITMGFDPGVGLLKKTGQLMLAPKVTTTLGEGAYRYGRGPIMSKVINAPTRRLIANELLPDNEFDSSWSGVKQNK